MTTPKIVRDECYRLIRECMKTRIKEYYEKYTDLVGDERSERAIHESLRGLECIFQILDNYRIMRPEKDE